MEVVIPSSNLGNGGGVNFALNKITTKYALYLDVDTVLDSKINLCFDFNAWNEILDDVMNVFLPRFKDDERYLKNMSSQEVSHMKFIEGCALLLNMRV